MVLGRYLVVGYLDPYGLRVTKRVHKCHQRGRRVNDPSTSGNPRQTQAAAGC